MELYVNPASELPIYRQIVHQVAAAIAGGRIRPGERLPSHRDLAAQLVIAPLTVKKAYDELEREGYLEMRRGRGTFVRRGLDAAGKAARRKRLSQEAARLVRAAEAAGVSLDQLIDELRTQAARLSEERTEEAAE